MKRKNELISCPYMTFVCFFYLLVSRKTVRLVSFEVLHGFYYCFSLPSVIYHHSGQELTVSLPFRCKIFMVFFTCSRPHAGYIFVQLHRNRNQTHKFLMCEICMRGKFDFCTCRRHTLCYFVIAINRYASHCILRNCMRICCSYENK